MIRILAGLLLDNKITLEDIANIPKISELAKLVLAGLEACKKTIVFPLGAESIKCYDYTDRFGEYHAWGICYPNGNLEFWTNWGGNHVLGQVNIKSSSDVFLFVDDEEFGDHLQRFLERQIEEAEKL